MKNQLVFLLLRTIAILPLGVARIFGYIVGSLAWLLRTRGTKVARVNLQHCFPEMVESDRRRLCKESMQEWGKTLLETPQVWQRQPHWLQDKVLRIDGRAIFDDLLNQQRGLIIIAPHLGNWEVVGLYCSTLCQMTSMFSPSGYEALDAWVKSARERVGARLVTADNRGVIQLLRALKQKEVIGILPDQVPEESGGVFAPLYGQPALTMTLIHNLLRRSGALAVFCYAKRVPGGFHLVFQGAPPAIYSENQEESLAALNRGVEDCVVGCCSQYQWEYKRFRKVPRGAAKIYTRENT